MNGKRKIIGATVGTTMNPAKMGSSYQSKIDHYLATDDKAIVGAINEIHSDVNYMLGNPTEGLEYTLSDDGTYYICSGLGDCSDVDITIPANYKGLPVEAIGPGAFEECEGITSIILPNSITRIGPSAFSYCSSLQTVQLNEGVTHIEDSAFDYCFALTTIFVPQSLCCVGSGAFDSGNSAMTVNYAGTEQEWLAIAIDEYNSKLTEAVINYNQRSTYVDNFVAVGKKLEKCVTLDGKQTITGRKTFTNKLHTSDIYVGGYFDENDAWKDSPETSSSLRVSGTVEFTGEVNAPNASFHTHHMDVKGELKVAGDARFDHDVRMTNSLRVDSKADIREGATIRGTLDMKGNDIKGVQSLKVEGTLDTYNDIKMKPNTGREDRVKLSDALNEALDFTFKNRVQIDGNDVTSYGTTVDYPNQLDIVLHLIETTSASIIDVKDGFIYELKKPIILTKSVTFLGSKKEKAQLVFNIPDAIEGHDYTIFKVLDPDVTVTFENVDIRVQTDGVDVNCNIVEFAYPAPSAGLEYTISDDGTYYTCSGIGTCTDTEIVIADQYNGVPVTAIYDAFNAENNSICANITKITLPNSITKIDSCAFFGCRNLAYVNIPQGVTSIGAQAFYDCSALSGITIPDSVTSIGMEAFFGCTSLNSIYIPKSVTIMEDNVMNYEGCTINCQATEQPDTWDAHWKTYIGINVIWGAAEPSTRYSLVLRKCTTSGNTTRRWLVDSLGISITESNLVLDKFVGNVQNFWYHNNTVKEMLPDFTELSYAEESSIDFFRGDLLVNGVSVMDAIGGVDAKVEAERMVGTWVFNDTLIFEEKYAGRHNVKFTVPYYSHSDKGEQSVLGINYDPTVDTYNIFFEDDRGYVMEDVYWSDSGWDVPLKTITITEATTDALFIEWLKANAVKRAIEYQPKTDNTLLTTSKTIHGAINELAEHTNEIVTATSDDGKAYVANVPWITELKNGVSFTMVPNVESKSYPHTLRVNDFEEYPLKRRLSSGGSNLYDCLYVMWLAANVPVRVVYYNRNWIVDSLPRPYANDLIGRVPTENGGIPAPTSHDQILGSAWVSGRYEPSWRSTDSIYEHVVCSLMPLIIQNSLEPITLSDEWHEEYGDVGKVYSIDDMWATHYLCDYYLENNIDNSISVDSDVMCVELYNYTDWAITVFVHFTLYRASGRADELYEIITLSPHGDYSFETDPSGDGTIDDYEYRIEGVRIEVQY